MRYDHPNCIVRREAQYQLTAGAAGVGAKFAVFQKSRLRSIASMVTAAGTNTANNTLIVKNGTTSIAQLVVGTATIGSVVRSPALNLDIAAGSVLTVTNGADTLGAGVFAYDYDVAGDAVYP